MTLLKMRSLTRLGSKSTQRLKKKKLAIKMPWKPRLSVPSPRFYPLKGAFTGLYGRNSASTNPVR